MGAFQEQMPGREEGRRSSEGEQEVCKTSRQLVLLAPGGFNEGTPASSVELDLPRVLGAHGECEEQGSEKISVKFLEEQRSDGRGCTAVRVAIGNGMRQLFVENKEECRNLQGKDPKNL